jgi:hypothetical protein
VRRLECSLLAQKTTAKSRTQRRTRVASARVTASIFPPALNLIRAIRYNFLSSAMDDEPWHNIEEAAKRLGFLTNPTFWQPSHYHPIGCNIRETWALKRDSFHLGSEPSIRHRGRVRARPGWSRAYLLTEIRMAERAEARASSICRKAVMYSSRIFDRSTGNLASALKYCTQVGFYSHQGSAYNSFPFI